MSDRILGELQRRGFTVTSDSYPHRLTAAHDPSSSYYVTGDGRVLLKLCSRSNTSPLHVRAQAELDRYAGSPTSTLLLDGVFGPRVSP